MTDTEMTVHNLTDKRRCWVALDTAAREIGARQYEVQRKAHIKAGRSPKTFKYTPTAAHVLLVDSIPQVISGELSIEDATAMLHMPEVMADRFPKRR